MTLNLSPVTLTCLDVNTKATDDDLATLRK
jgi:hypothetical protein